MAGQTDTDGIYDRCHCGERPSLVWRGDCPTEYKVECNSCGECTRWRPTKTAVMVDWNRKMRGVK